MPIAAMHAVSPTLGLRTLKGVPPILGEMVIPVRLVALNGAENGFNVVVGEALL
ncbi:hypothetical protein SOASR015_12330 [Pectobacterium carotovorum subsp. carotovorum]|nr:hypothetical protein SOASR015_12330 [Pectobacterium carotovorum subsp. carotovorum]GLX55622.1 hypothetical protein Pcaca02_09310 [Pectobacterium carotovorum subsp. carotovorum]